MEKKIVPTIMLTLLVVSTLGFASDVAWITSLSPKIVYVDWRYPAYGNYRWIHEAIDDPYVGSGDIIRVMWGSGAIPYTEQVNVTKSVTIEGYDGIPIIDGGGKGAVFNVSVSNVVLFNLRIQNGTIGINLFPSATSSNVTNNFVKYTTECGICVRSGNNIIKGNKLTLNEMGIYVSSGGNLLRNNNMTSNVYNFGISNFVNNDIDSSNTVNGKPIYVRISVDHWTVPSDAGYVAAVNSRYVIVGHLAKPLSKNDYGVQFINTSDSIIANVEVSQNSGGVYLLNAKNITIKNVNASHNMNGITSEASNTSQIVGNIVSNNQICGIYSFNSRDNTFVENTIQKNIVGIQDFIGTDNIFHHNNIKNNNLQVMLADSLDLWDNNNEGNYWSDFTVIYPSVRDADRDGIWDHYYEVDIHNFDRYPLVDPWKPVRLFNAPKKDPKYPTVKSYNITVQSDHVIASINFSKPIGGYYPRTLSFNLTAGSSGFFNITIPRAWLDGPFDLLINNVPTDFVEVIQNANVSCLYFTYYAGKYQVKINGAKLGAVRGDINGDGRIDMGDIYDLCKSFGWGTVPSILLTEIITNEDP